MDNSSINLDTTNINSNIQKNHANKSKRYSFRHTIKILCCDLLNLVVPIIIVGATVGVCIIMAIALA
jgi:hypothetical protein